MKLRYGFSVLALVLASHHAFAAESVNFTGDWVGSGQLTGTNGAKSTCSKIHLIIDHQVSADPQVLTVRLYDANCGALPSQWGPYPFEIRGGKVFEDGEETGTLQGDLFKSLQASGGAQYAFNMRLVAGARLSDDVLRSYYGVRNMIGTIVIEGDLHRASNWDHFDTEAAPRGHDDSNFERF